MASLSSTTNSDEFLLKVNQGMSITVHHHKTINNGDDEKVVAEKDALLDVEQSNKTKNQGEPFNYDDILEQHLGQLGKFQLRSFLLLCIPALFPGLIAMSYTFTGAVPNYRYNYIPYTCH